MARLRMLELDELAPDVRAKVEAREAAGLRLIPRIEAHVPGVADAQAQMARALAENGGLSPRLFELIRLRIAFHNQCRTCMSIRYASAYDGTFDENLVCSLEKPQESDDLSAAERSALDFADRFANNHLSIDDAVYDGLREHFDEHQIVAIGYVCAMSVGFGRLAATWDVVESLSDDYLEQSGTYTPWGAEPTIVGRRRT
jgi:alkylhydroperoxidase family enzyme